MSGVTAVKKVGVSTSGGKTLSEQEEIIAVAEIVHHGDRLILPESMSMDSAINLLQRRKKYLEEDVAMQESFDVFPWDGAHALDIVLTRIFGWSPANATPGFFGPTPPSLISVAISPTEKKSVTWGRLGLPNITGFLQTGHSKNGAGRVVFTLHAVVKRKDEAAVKRIFVELEAELKRNSIYRGKAIKMRFNDDHGAPLEMPEPKFIDTSTIDESMLIFSDHVMDAIETNLFTPLRRVNELKLNGIPIKRSVMLGGIFGTGKTLAASVASKIATSMGITYLYVPRADELKSAIEFAKQYQTPACVIFCEDVDRETNGERTVEMDDLLNLVDGIDTKNSNIITVLTTNDIEAVHPAMLRFGRLDAIIDVTPPDAKAIERLLRAYGGESIPADTNLSKVGQVLDGTIPAAVAEVVKRAKLAQLKLNKPGERVWTLTEEALLESARTMHQQLELLERRSNEKTSPPTLDGLFGDMVEKVVNTRAESEHLYRVGQTVNKIAATVGAN